MTILLYILLGISVLAPIYTYAVYPFVLRLFKPRSRETKDEYCPEVSVLIIGVDEEKCKEKERNVRASDYPNITEIIIVKNQHEAVALLKKKKGGVVVITDQDSVFLGDTITNVIKPLLEPFVGCVSGMVRKRPNEQGEYQDGANWKYENKIKELESNIGCLSGANTSIYAFNRAYIPDEFDERINLDFYIPTSSNEWGFDVLFEPKSVAYEPSDRTETDLFWKHVADGASGYCSIVRFRRLLLPKKGSFVFWSHRVMKWLVPFNMLILLIVCAVLAFHYKWALLLLLAQVLFYVVVAGYYQQYTKAERELPGPLGKLLGFASYFVVLNVAWLLGLFSINKERI